jgi:hypothetical protein
MMSRLFFMFALFSMAVSLGCSGKPKAQPRPNLAHWQAAFRQADKFELYSILPIYGDTSDQPKFMSFPIVGSTTITDPSEKEKLYQLLEEFIYDVPVEQPNGVTACKIMPHHALSFTDKSDTHEIAICFICGQVITKSKSLPTYIGDVGLSAQAKTELESILKAHGVETAEESSARQRK